jgi:hypothetical protein
MRHIFLVALSVFAAGIIGAMILSTIPTTPKSTNFKLELAIEKAYVLQLEADKGTSDIVILNNCMRSPEYVQFFNLKLNEAIVIAIVSNPKTKLKGICATRTNGSWEKHHTVSDWMNNISPLSLAFSQQSKQEDSLIELLNPIQVDFEDNTLVFRLGTDWGANYNPSNYFRIR